MSGGRMNCERMMNFIIEKQLTDSVAILLHPDTFDALALDYIGLNGTIERPFEILGIKIIEDTGGKTGRNDIKIIIA